MDFEETRLRRLRSLTLACEAACTRVAGALPFLNDIYAIKAKLADDVIKDSTSPAGRAALELLKLEADERKTTVVDHAQAILAKRNAWYLLGMKLEAVRTKAKTAFMAATTKEELLAADADALAAIRAVEGEYNAW